jgi:uncharacterized protein YndB with AHSA1/START domain
MNKSTNLVEETRQEIVITRVFDAPRARLWKAWTDPELMKRWWGGKGITCPVCSIDLRVGGHYKYSMQFPDGLTVWATGVYREIHEPDHLVFTDSFGDENGNIVSPTMYGMGADFPEELLIELTFEKVGNDKTKLTLRHIGLPLGQDRELTGVGWNESFDKLDVVLKS